MKQGIGIALVLVVTVGVIAGLALGFFKLYFYIFRSLFGFSDSTGLRIFLWAIAAFAALRIVAGFAMLLTKEDA